MLRVRAEIHTPAADVLRIARWGGEETDAAANGAGAKIAVAERLILFRVCPLTVEVAKLLWAPSLAAAPWSLGERSEADSGKFVIGYAARRVRVELEVSANCGGTIVDLQDGIQLDIARVETRRAVIQKKRSESADPHPTDGAGRVSSRPLSSADDAAGAGAESSACVDAGSVDDGSRQAFAAAGEPIEVDLPRCISQHSDGCAGEQGHLELDVRIQDREHVEVSLTQCPMWLLLLHAPNFLRVCARALCGIDIIVQFTHGRVSHDLCSRSGGEIFPMDTPGSQHKLGRGKLQHEQREHPMQVAGNRKRRMMWMAAPVRGREVRGRESMR